jgi:hypothetical protein
MSNKIVYSSHQQNIQLLLLQSSITLISNAQLGIRSDHSEFTLMSYHWLEL